MIEDKLEDVIHHIIRAAVWKKEYAAYHRKREEEWKIEQKRREETERLARIEKQRISQLEEGYKKWLRHKELSECRRLENSSAADTREAFASTVPGKGAYYSSLSCIPANFIRCFNNPVLSGLFPWIGTEIRA